MGKRLIGLLPPAEEEGIDSYDDKEDGYQHLVVHAALRCRRFRDANAVVDLIEAFCKIHPYEMEELILEWNSEGKYYDDPSDY